MSHPILQHFGCAALAADGQTTDPGTLTQAAAMAVPGVTADPGAWSSIVTGFIAVMAKIEKALKRWQDTIGKAGAAVANRPNNDPDKVYVLEQANRLVRAQAAYRALAEGFWKAAEPSDGRKVFSGGFGAVWVPVAVVAGIAVGIVAIAWAYVSRQSAETLLADIALQDRELGARVEAMRAGTQLQQPTLPRLQPNPSGMMPQLPGDDGGWLSGIFPVVVAGGLLFGMYEMNRRGYKMPKLR